MPEGWRRNHGNDFVRECKEVDVQCRQNGFQRISLLFPIDYGEWRLAVAFQRITVICSTKALDCGTELEAMVHV